MNLPAGSISHGRKLFTFGLLAFVAMAALLATSSADAAGPLAPVNNWTEQTPAEPTQNTASGASAYDEANGELVYFGGDTGTSLSNETWTWDGNDWTKENPAHSPSARFNTAMAFDPSTGSVLLFGGFNLAGLGDTWTWDGNDWHELTPAASPSGRAGARMAFDAASGRMLLFGGSSFGNHFNETWAWNGSNWAQLSPAHSPSPRHVAAMSFDQATGKIVLYGGYVGNGVYLGDTWTWDDNDWTEQSPAHTPGTRGFAAMDFNPALGQTLLFGGTQTGSGSTNSLWAWDGADWNELTPADQPARRSGPAMSFDPSMGEMVMTGGRIDGGGSYDDTWTYGPPAGVNVNWSEQSPAHELPDLRNAAMAFDQSTGEVVFFGGADQSGDTDETWVWDGSDWTRKFPVHSPTARSEASMVFDPARGEVVLFGGKSDSPSAEILGDTWVWDGVDWTKKSPANSPTPRFSTVMAFDGASGQSVLFGGSDGIFRLNQTWVWNGNNWTQKSPTTVPPRRVTAGMTFDPTSGGIMMFGGFGGVAPGDQKYLDDTWTWDGSNWILKSPATKPSGRFGFQMAFDPAIGRTVLFGGATSASGMNDTWTWDGSDWKLLTPGTSPASNAGGSMAFDPSSGSMVLFSGRGNSTWLFRLEVSPPTAQITTPADSQTYTVGEVVATDFNCEEAVGGPGVANCEDSNGSSNPAGTLDTSALGPQTYTVTATSENGLTGTAEIGYTVEQAEPTVAASGAEAEVQIGSSLKVDADLADAYQPSGSFIYRVYGPDDTTCSATPAFESSPVTVNDNGLYPGPNFTPTEPGTYRWIITYSGDTNNQAAASDCGANGSTSTITEDPPAPPPPPPTYECPAARPGLKVTGFGLKAPFGNAPPVFGVRVALRSNNAIVKIKPSMTYRLAGKNRTVKLKARTLEVNGRRQLRFRAPKQLKKNFRKAGVSIRRAPVTFKLKAQIRPQGSKAECFRKLRTSKLKTRLVEVSSRVALKRLGGR